MNEKFVALGWQPAIQPIANRRYVLAGVHGPDSRQLGWYFYDSWFNIPSVAFGPKVLCGWPAIP